MRPDVDAARQRWRASQDGLNPARLVFIDETGTTTNMARVRGRSEGGERLVSAIPHGHWKITTLVAGLRHDGLTAPFVIDRPMNGAIFVGYFEQCLASTLSPGDIVVMDNLPAHKVARVRRGDPRQGRQTDLPAALLARPQPDRAPLCQAQGTVALRKATKRSISPLWTRIGKLLDQFSADECRHYLAHAGYV